MQTDQTTATAIAAARGAAPALADHAAEETFLTLTVAGQGCGVPVLAVRDVLGA
jgi:purine-binding chemotaxis protein CheW